MPETFSFRNQNQHVWVFSHFTISGKLEAYYLLDHPVQLCGLHCEAPGTHCTKRKKVFAETETFFLHNYIEVNIVDIKLNLAHSP